MSYEVIKQIKRTLWISKCPTCGDSKESTERTSKERLCRTCKIWVPYEKVSYTGPELVEK